MTKTTLVKLKIIENAFIWGETPCSKIDQLVIDTLNELVSAQKDDWFRFQGPSLTNDDFREYWYRDKRTDKIYYVYIQTDRFRTPSSVDKLIFHEVIQE